MKLVKTLILAKTGQMERGRGQRMRWLGGISDSVHMNLSKLQETVEETGAWHAAVYGVTVRQDLATEQQQYVINITELDNR